MKYIYVKDNVLGVVLDEKPNWFLDSGEAPSDQWFIDNEGLYPFIGEFDGNDAKLVKPETEWSIEIDRVAKTYYNIVDDYNMGVVETVGKYYEKTDPSQWIINGDDIAVVYVEKVRMDVEVRSFISKNIVDDNGYDESIHQLNIMDEWLWDRENHIIIKDYWTIIRMPDNGIGSDTDMIFYDVAITPWNDWSRLPEKVIEEGWSSRELPVDEIKTNLKEFIADYRWKIEVGGCVYGDASIQTDRESQSKLASVYSVISSGVYTGDVEWKTFDGFRDYTQTDFNTMALYVFGFIDEIYKKESTIIGQIDAATTKDQLVTIRQNIETEMHNAKSVFCTT